MITRIYEEDGDREELRAKINGLYDHYPSMSIRTLVGDWVKSDRFTSKLFAILGPLENNTQIPWLPEKLETLGMSIPASIPFFIRLLRRHYPQKFATDLWEFSFGDNNRYNSQGSIFLFPDGNAKGIRRAIDNFSTKYGRENERLTKEFLNTGKNKR